MKYNYYKPDDEGIILLSTLCYYTTKELICAHQKQCSGRNRFNTGNDLQITVYLTGMLLDRGLRHFFETENLPK